MSTNSNALSLDKIIAGVLIPVISTFVISCLDIDTNTQTELEPPKEESLDEPGLTFYYKVEEYREDEKESGLYFVRATLYDHSQTLDTNFRIYCPSRMMRQTTYKVFDIEGKLIDQGDAYTEGAFSPRDESEERLFEQICDR